MLALLRSLSLSLPPKLFLSRQRADVSYICPRDDKRAFVHYFIGVEQTTPFSKIAASNPLALLHSLLLSPSLSLSLAFVGNKEG